MGSLFEIEKNLYTIVSQVIENEGELTPELNEQLVIAEAELEVKANQYNWVIKNFESNNLAIDAEIERLVKLKKSNTRVIEKLEGALLNTVINFGVERKGVKEIILPTITLKTRKSTSIKINGVIDDKYKLVDLKLNNLNVKDSETLTKLLTKHNMPFTATVKESKTLIKADIEAGTSVLNASLETNYNLHIK